MKYNIISAIPLTICVGLLVSGKNFFYPYSLSVYTQSAFTCLKLTIETLQQGVKYVQNSQ